jgi:hypothetical protein
MLPILKNVLLETKGKYNNTMTLRLSKTFAFYSKYILFNFAILTLLFSALHSAQAGNKATCSWCVLGCVVWDDWGGLLKCGCASHIQNIVLNLGYRPAKVLKNLW